MPAVRMEKSKPMTIAYVEHLGSYDAIPLDKYVGELAKWASEKGLRTSREPVGIFYDAPDTTPPGMCRSEIGIPVTGVTQPEGAFKLKEMPGMDVAVVNHDGPARDYAGTYRALTEWIAGNGYEGVGPSFETYPKKPTKRAGELILHTKIHAPVRKKAP